MEKTISINLNNQNFQIEEEAYNKLSDYLENIKKHCGAGADAAEVIADIENSMAEKLKSTLTPYKEVITTADIDSLITIMGTTEDFDREIGSNNEASDNSEEPAGQKIKRKLYRDTDNGVIGGVAAGLGAYFDVDPVIFRIIFCLLVFARGSALIIYIILWIAMPEAKTAHQKLEMQGQMPTLAALKNLSQTGKKKSKSDWKEEWHKKSVWEKILNLPLIIIRGLFNALKKCWQAIWPIAVFCFGLGITIFSFIGLGFVGVGSLFMLLYNNSSYQWNFIPIAELTNLVPYTWMILTGFLSLAIPAIFGLIIGLMIILRKKIINLKTSGILAGIWMIAGIFFIALALRYLPPVYTKIKNYPATKQVEQGLDLKGVKEIQADGHLIDIFVTAETSTPATISGRQIDLNYVSIKRNGDKLIITGIKPDETNQICLDCGLREVELTAPTGTGMQIKTTGGATVNYDEIETAESDEETEELATSSKTTVKKEIKPAAKKILKKTTSPQK